MNLINRTFCRLHDSPRFNHIQVDLWERIKRSIQYLSTLEHLFDVYRFLNQQVRPNMVHISEAIDTNQILVDGFGLEPEVKDISCNGIISLTDVFLG